MTDALRALFCPKSIAVVGASAATGKAGNAMVRSLLGFPGILHLVNPRATEIEGRAVAPSVASIGGPIDLAVLVVPAEAVPTALEDCGAAGVRAAVVCAGGFAETTGGRHLQDEASAIARRHGVRLLGPNTSGFMNVADGVMANFVPYVTRLEPGPASIVASSGGMNLAVSFLANGEGLGLRIGVGLGNAADVGFAEVLDFLADDDATKVIGVHLEGVDDGRALFEAVARTSERKPVVALKVGRSEVSEFAVSHTGRLIGDFSLSCTALAQAGAVLVDDVGQLVDAMRALVVRRVRPSSSPGVAVVTAQAGPGLLITDVLRSRGVSVPPLADSTVKRLQRLLPPLTLLSNPVDTGRPSETFGQVLALVAADDAVDAMVMYALKESDVVNPEVAFRTPGVAGELPVVFGTSGPREMLDLSQRVFDGDRSPAVPHAGASGPSRVRARGGRPSAGSHGRWVSAVAAIGPLASRRTAARGRRQRPSRRARCGDAESEGMLESRRGTCGVRSAGRAGRGEGPRPCDRSQGERRWCAPGDRDT